MADAPAPRRRPIASAWLIATFIDPSATFALAPSPSEWPDAVAFDMFGGDWLMSASACTFEVLVARFGIGDPSSDEWARSCMTDLNDARYRPSEAASVAVMVEGLRARFRDDGALLQAGHVLFDAVYRGLGATHQAPRRVHSIPRKKAGAKS